MQGNILSTNQLGEAYPFVHATSLRSDMGAGSSQPQSGSTSPSFVMCTAISSTGVIAIGTADGRVIIGSEGTRGNAKKKSRKWNGLSFDESKATLAANGPIVAL